MPRDSAVLAAQLERLDESLIRWISRIEPVVFSTWPMELFTRLPAEAEVCQRWENTFRALELNAYIVHYEANSPSPWRARRLYHPRDNRYYFESFLPQIGDYLNHAFDANPRQDVTLWQRDLVTFFASAFRLIHYETTQVAREVDHALQAQAQQYEAQYEVQNQAQYEAGQRQRE
jgi:hypothetical protein